ncbi:MAG: hypothetical protein GC179_22425 [Anaerolineaceae bacterium]|nr:hypothetical protein [Anaerolineaceae bacterium]
MSDLVIHVTDEQRQRIEERARQHGFETLTDYLLSLVEEDEPTKEELLNGFREGWAAAMSGDTIPASKLWEFIDLDE